MKNSADQGVCYPPIARPRAELNYTLRDLENSSYPTKAEFNNCFIIYSKYFPVLKVVSPFRSLFFCSPKITQSHPQVFSVNGSIICSGLRFWRHWLNNLQRAIVRCINRALVSIIQIHSVGYEKCGGTRKYCYFIPILHPHGWKWQIFVSVHTYQASIFPSRIRISNRLLIRSSQSVSAWS